LLTQHVHRAAGARGRRQELVGGAGSGQVEHHHLDPHAVAAGQLSFQCPELVLAPGHQRQAGPGAGQLAGEVGPEAAGRALHQRVPSLQNVVSHGLFLSSRLSSP
jgi:hypothetical protein